MIGVCLVAVLLVVAVALWIRKELAPVFDADNEIAGAVDCDHPDCFLSCNDCGGRKP